MKQITRTVLCIAVCLLIANIADAQIAKDDYAAKTFKSKSGGELLYRQFIVKNAEPGKKYPLLLFLHGGGSRGNDNHLQLRVLIGSLKVTKFHRQHTFYCLLPQVPRQKSWSGPTMDMTLELLDKFIKEEAVDPSRVYVTGNSMGGYGTWEAIRRRPELFAAAVPMCGGGHLASAKKMAKVPLWIFHGAKDHIVPVKLSRDMVKAIKEAGGNPKYSEYPDVRHGVWWDAYKDPKLWKWMFAQKKSVSSPKPAVAPGKKPEKKTFEKTEFKTASGRGLRYSILRPTKVDTDGKYPLVITLHGVGGQGARDWERSCYANSVLAKPAMRTKFPCFVAAPTVEKPSGWAGERLVDVFELIEHLKKELSVDPDRVYVTGQSMGGYGTFAAIVRQPGLFAAAAPVCGGNKPANAKIIANIPIWIFHGAKDPTVPVARSREMVEALQKAGGKPKYTEFPNVRHGAWTPAYDNEDLWEWMFNQRREKP